MKYLVFIGLLFYLPITLVAQSVSDPNFEVNLTNPLYPAKDGPLILFDQQHYNAFSLNGQYKGFADVVLAEGYQLQNQQTVVSTDALSALGIFVTVAPLNHPSNWDLPNVSIFTEAEIEALYRWVHDEGGGLFIVSDQMPSSGAVSGLAERFGFTMINGFTWRLEGQADIFNRSAGTLLSSPVTDWEGREIQQWRFWNGSGFIPPQEAIVFSRLGGAYRIYLPSKAKDMEQAIRDDIPYISGRNIANGALLECGKGRVCVITDATPFSAQLKGINSQKQGMNHPDAKDHVPLLRNILHWLNQK